MPGGSTFRQCTHCLEKINCANRRCTKCGKLLDLKSRQTARMRMFQTKAKEWAQKVKKSRNQAKIFDNSSLLMEKLKALGFFPLLLWGKYRLQNKKWVAQLQCPFEMPVLAHAVMEKIICLFEGLLEACVPEREEVGEQVRTGEDEVEREIDEHQRGQKEQREVEETESRDMQEIEVQEDREETESAESEEMEGRKYLEELGLMETEQVQEDREESESGEREEMEGRKDLEELGLMETAQAQEEKVDSKMVEREEMEGQKDLGADKEREQTAKVGKRKIKEKKKVVATNRKVAVNISAKKKRRKRRQTEDDACQYHNTLDIFPVQCVSMTRERKGCKEVLVHWLPCPSCQKAWPPSWEPQENIGMNVS